MKRKLRKMMCLVMAVFLLAGSLGMECFGTEAEAEEQESSFQIVTIRYSDKTDNKTLFYWNGTSGHGFSHSPATDVSSLKVKDIAGMYNVTAERGSYKFLDWNYYFVDGEGNRVSADEEDKFDYKYTTLVCEPIWAGIVSYNVNYPSSGYQGPDAVSWTDEAEENTPITVSSAASTGEYTFSGWLDSDTGKIYMPGSSYVVKKDNVTFTGQWKPVSYKVTYADNGASSGVPAVQQADFGTTVTVGAAPVRKGYTFLGWEQPSGGTASAGSTFTMPANDVTLTAKWKIALTGVSGKGTFYLVKGQQYTMDAALKVSGDVSIYPSGITFYVPADSNYTFE